MVKLVTNRPAYTADIAEVLRLFLGGVTVSASEDLTAETTVSVAVSCPNERGYSAEASCGGAKVRVLVPYGGDAPLYVKRDEKRALKIAVFRLFKSLYPDTPTPWGSLTGIRPTKLFRELSAECGPDGADTSFRELFDVSEPKRALTRTISIVQTPFIESAHEGLCDVYIGIPFCRTRCLYCSFGSLLAGSESELDDYLAVLRRDIAAGAALLRDSGRTLRCLYVGGGTPTVLSADRLEALLGFTLSVYGGFGAECTVEAGRPDTIDKEKLAALKRCGVNRISVNPQTMSDDTLLRIGRAHTAKDTERAFGLARSIGFPVINMDLIAGLPGETSEDFTATLERVETLAPDDLTVHTLAVKRSSRLKERLDEYPMPDADTADRMVRLGAGAAGRLGMRPYYMYRQKYMRGNLENVGYARPGTECLYNIDMMEETVSILAHGAGAMTKRVFGAQNRIERIPNPKDVPTYAMKLDRLLDEKKKLFIG